MLTFLIYITIVLSGELNKEVDSRRVSLKRTKHFEDLPALVSDLLKEKSASLTNIKNEDEKKQKLRRIENFEDLRKIDEVSKIMEKTESVPAIHQLPEKTTFCIFEESSDVSSEASQLSNEDLLEASQLYNEDLLEASQLSNEDLLEASQLTNEDLLEASQLSNEDLLEASKAVLLTSN
ncbi:hypothetical protein NGRA_0906 [Nosema granulosis]|uniref:Uncharacterized protein n=1 Tax=Nosema granulosis TaxID=83296 RepID=A0A9P6KZW0_9MICR|nr:hypothetical protein NGRA_0906 [Nosema granulosis]